MEPDPSTVQLEIIEFIAQFVHDRMMQVPLDFNNISYPAFDHWHVSAYEWTAQILSDVGLLKPIDAEHDHLFVFICEPENFKNTIFCNAKQIPTEADCLRCLIDLSEQACVIFEQPFLGFLERQGIVEQVEIFENHSLAPAVEDVLRRMGIENDKTLVQKLTHYLNKNSIAQIPIIHGYNFTDRCKRPMVLKYIQNQGGSTFVEHTKSRRDFLF